MHPVAGGGAHGRAILGMRPPQVVITHAAALVVVAHVWVRGRWRVGTRKAGPEYSSGAVHIHFAIHICRRGRKKKTFPALVSLTRVYTQALLSLTECAKNMHQLTARFILWLIVFAFRQCPRRIYSLFPC